MPLLDARALVKRYASALALDGVSLAVEEGECVALVGESGSGKTTLLRSFNRMVEPDAGELWLDGRLANSQSAVELRRHMGYVPQTGGLMPHWRVGRNVELVPRLIGRPTPEADARRALELVGLPSEVHGARWPQELSGGQRQRVALARALASAPKIILLDEPFGALDAISRAELQRMFGDLRHSLRITAVLVTHDLREAAALADRIAVLRAGRIEQVAAPARLLAAPATAYVHELLTRAGVRDGW